VDGGVDKAFEASVRRIYAEQDGVRKAG